MRISCLNISDKFIRRNTTEFLTEIFKNINDVFSEDDCRLLCSAK